MGMSSSSESAEEGGSVLILLEGGEGEGEGLEIGGSLGWVIGTMEGPNWASRNMQRRERRVEGEGLAWGFLWVWRCEDSMYHCVCGQQRSFLFTLNSHLYILWLG